MDEICGAVALSERLRIAEDKFEIHK